MEVNILKLIDGAKRAEGLTVIIDVFRAFSTACYVFANGAERIFPVGEIKKAYALKKQFPEFILLGERDGKKLPKCDYGNSPAEIEEVDFEEKNVIHTTSAGTQGIVNATGAEEIITGSFVNLEAVVNYIKKSAPEIVSLVGMGEGGKIPAAEDDICARYIKNRLENKTTENFISIKSRLREGNGSKFFDENKKWFKKRDFTLCMKLNEFNFVLKTDSYKLKNNEEIISLKKVII
ncbi:MAG: 2-phosphosulfolactate phosphatase [Bacillota bacterium]